MTITTFNRYAMNFKELDLTAYYSVYGINCKVPNILGCEHKRPITG